MAGSFSPLFDPDRDGLGYIPPLDQAIERARETLAEKGSANLHDGDEMIRAAYGLAHVLASLLDALDADRAR
ncbi:hypothetical protein [Streptomyces nymphaeiformis]|uniref:Uncharacterized protein n=1 Tax=Streptomyces nymphaeiformis TaxID=2663842 RepID=A0A7W7U4N3_9ACTN|nr:hypothetical protein [Streptomyces nymphaeiformis]MBB4984998.1 hypothetical protein [Streptomyces nymphaeiformis]